MQKYRTNRLVRSACQRARHARSWHVLQAAYVRGRKCGRVPERKRAQSNVAINRFGTYFCIMRSLRARRARRARFGDYL